MEGKKQGGSEGYSSFASELFGSKDSSFSSTTSSSSSSSSTGIFGSIFAPTSNKVLGRESVRTEGVGEAKQDSHGIDSWDNRFCVSSDGYKSGEGGSRALNGDSGINYHEQRVHPCHLSSSIYYGGQDVYNQPQSSQGPNTNSVYKKDGTDDDSGIASRGNWWQGSLYY